MANDYSTASLIASIKTRGTIPTNQSTFTNLKILNLATDEMLQTIVPFIMSVREDYFLKSVDVIATGVFPKVVEIPEDAIGMKIKDIGVVTSGGEFVTLPRMELRDLNQTYNYGFLVEGNKLKIYVQNQSQFRIYYYKRPLTLIEENQTTSTPKITAIDPMTNTVTVTASTTPWTTASFLNAVKTYQPFDSTGPFDILSISLPNIILDSVEGLSVGDYLCLEGFSPIPQLPVEAQICLAQATVVKILEALGDDTGMTRAEKKLGQLLDMLYKMIQPRVDDSPKKIIDTGISTWSPVSRRWR